MAIHVSCPHCENILRLPDGCEGLPARCPCCLADFAIPGVATAPPTAAICAVLAPTAGTVTPSDVEKARHEAEQLATVDMGLQIQVARAKHRLSRLTARLQLARMFLDGRKTLDLTVGRIGGFFLAVTLGGALLAVFASLFSPGAWGYFTAITIGLILAGVAYLPFSFVPDDEPLAQYAARIADRAGQAEQEFREVSATAETIRQKVTAAEAEHQRLQLAIESRLHELRTCNWQTMTAAGFEEFLARLFEEQGFQVERTGRVADQGVDLIIQRGDLRAAVQAKGYLSETVGNQAVQAVHAGMGFYRCNAAVVVTNSRYTAAALALAARIGCTLVDGSQIPELIEGRVPLRSVPAR